jgi:hypothetical protein
VTAPSFESNKPTNGNGGAIYNYRAMAQPRAGSTFAYSNSNKGSDVDNNEGGDVTFDACGESKAMGDCCTLPPPTC